MKEISRVEVKWQMRSYRSVPPVGPVGESALDATVIWHRFVLCQVALQTTSAVGGKKWSGGTPKWKVGDRDRHAGTPKPALQHMCPIHQTPYPRFGHSAHARKTSGLRSDPRACM